MGELGAIIKPMITKSQWNTKLEDCATTLRKVQGIPAAFTIVTQRDSMIIRSGHCRGSVSLSVGLEELGAGFCVPKIRADSGAALVGTVEELADGVAEYRTVLAILRFMRDNTAGLQIEM